jgi:hypothetical protein
MAKLVMIEILSKKIILIFSIILTIIMFIIVVFIVSPMMDGGDGTGVVKLQLSFQKVEGIKIVESWGQLGISNFNKWIFTDYIYAFAYSLLFATILARLIKKRKLINSNIKYLVLLPFVAGLLDMTENTMELFFINNQTSFSNSLFYLHSLVSTVKFLLIAISLILIIVLWLKKKKIYK